MWGYSIKAIVSLIFAILGLCLMGIILGPIAMCLGFRALSEIKEQQENVKGKWMAASGVVICHRSHWVHRIRRFHHHYCPDSIN
jgi:hypothetical protein